MRMKRKPAAIDAKNVMELFKQIEAQLKMRNKKIKVTVLGGIAIILQGFRERATLDIDIAPTKDAEIFCTVCQILNIPVDIITIATTVDLAHVQTIPQFTGPFLVVESIGPEELIKLKLERFYKQDPEDIYAIIDHLRLPFEPFSILVKEILKDYIGNPRTLILSALQVAEIKYPEKAKSLEKQLFRE